MTDTGPDVPGSDGGSKFLWACQFPGSLNAKKLDLLGFFNIHSVAKHQKIEGGPFGEFFSKKTERGAFNLPVLYVTRKKMKNLFGSVR